MIRFEIKVLEKTDSGFSGKISLHTFGENRIVGSFLFSKKDGVTHYEVIPESEEDHLPNLTENQWFVLGNNLRTWLKGYNKENDFFYWDWNKNEDF